MNLTPAEENYLKAVYHLSNGGNKKVSTNAIAESLQTKPASVTDMIRKLSDKGLLTYRKYQGVNMSEAGLKATLAVVRKHRLWKVFLVQKLKFHWDEVHEMAGQLEHINSPLLFQRLDEFLGFPKSDPHGEPIPDEEGQITTKDRYTLTELGTGEKCVLVAVKDNSALFLQYLDKMHINLGDSITVTEKIAYDGSMMIDLQGKASISVSREVASNLMVVK